MCLTFRSIRIYQHESGHPLYLSSKFHKERQNSACDYMIISPLSKVCSNSKCSTKAFQYAV